MKIEISSGRSKRDISAHVESLKLRAEHPEDPLILAAIANALTTDKAPLLRNAIADEAERILDSIPKEPQS